MIGRKGRQECLPPSQECLQSYICKPANYQPPALIELVFGRFSPAPDMGDAEPCFLKSGLRVYDP